MEKLCPLYRRKVTRAGLACVLGICAPQILPPLAAQESVVQQEINRRAENSRKAYELLKTGDQAYNKKDYKAAVKDYSQAFDLLPSGHRSEEIRVIAAGRYATAATEQARKLAKSGDYEAARNLLDTVLKPEIAPTHMGALKMRGQIDDPIRYNHALTPQHVRDAAKVGRNLREAEGFYNLGQYDRALTIYKSVLLTDPYNTAARRGMEKVETAKQDYYRAANGHTRAELLSQVDKTWEMFIPPAGSTPVPLQSGKVENFAPDARDRLAGITLDVVDLDNVTISEALDFVRIQSRLGDAPGPDGEKTGVNIVLNTGDPSSDTAKRIASSRVTLKARSLPISKVLDYIADQTRTQWRTDGVGILVTPLGSTDAALSNRTFRVPPNFLRSAAIGEKKDEGNIFDGDDNGEGLLKKRMSITDFLKQNGVSFPDGASATYTPSNNLLRIRNTPGNIDLIDQLVSIVAGEAPVQVKVQTTIMRVGQNNLKELGFDWAITPWSIGKNALLGGGTTGNGTVLGGFGGTAIAGTSGITSGNRSGDGAIQPDSIDALLASASTGAVATSTANRAPGILTLSYIGSGVQVQMMMRGLNRNKGTDVMVNPSIVSRSGERSKVEIIREFIYPTEYEPPELPNAVGAGTGGVFPVTPATPTAFETRNVGVTLEVEPTVGPDKNFIELSLRPELVEFQGFVNYGSPINVLTVEGLAGGAGTSTITENRILMPVFRTIRMPNTAVTIQDGSTVVLGGLMTSRKTKIEDKTPILGDIPYVGRLFRSEADQTITQAIIIMVNVELVDPTGRPWRNR